VVPRLDRSKRKTVTKGGGPSRVVRHDVREEIERRILSGESKPGERLSQQSLARELGVAQGTVRESLMELQWLGLVESTDRLGVFVDKLDVNRICEAYLVREVMEGLAARLASQNAGRTDIAELRKLADRIYELAQSDNAETASLDRNFHMSITELTRNATLMRLAKTYRALGMTVRAFREPEVIHAEHLRIIEAIEHGFAEEAERQARSHVVGARQMIELRVQQGLFVPTWVK
jgi:DNA-binding GntR family transcriptional regulator